MFFFFNDTATTEIYTLSLHDALPISASAIMPGTGSGFSGWGVCAGAGVGCCFAAGAEGPVPPPAASMLGASACRSEEHTSELQSQSNLVCRLLLEKKKSIDNTHHVCA